MRNINKKTVINNLNFLSTGFIVITIIMFSLLSVIVFSSSNQPDERLIGYELLDNNKVVHIWNTEDDYYFNRTSGIQFTNHFNNYWTKNVFCGGVKINGDWNYYCNDALSFDWSITSDNLTKVNITGNRTVTMGGKTVMFKLDYNLGVNDTELRVIPYMINLDGEITQKMRFLWQVRDIIISNYSLNDELRINGTQYLLNQTLNIIYPTVIGSNYSIIDSASVDLRWDPDINYAVQVLSESGQYNAPVTLAITFTGLAVGQTRTTTLFWKDPPQGTLTDTSLTADSTVDNGTTMLVEGIFDCDGTASEDFTIFLEDDGNNQITNTCTTSFKVTAISFDCTGVQNGCTNNGDGSILADNCKADTPKINWTLEACVIDEDNDINTDATTTTGATITLDNVVNNIQILSPPTVADLAIFDNDTLLSDTTFTTNDPVFINITVTDQLQGSDIEHVDISILNGSNDAFIINQSMIKELAVNDGNVYNYSFVVPADKGVGTFTVEVFASDYNNSNSSLSTTTFEVIIYGVLNVTLTTPTNETVLAQYETFDINATVSCEGLGGAVCGTVSAYARYNWSSIVPNTLVNTTTGDVPLFAFGGEKELCYQETANESTDCGGLNTGVYSDDGNWIDPVSELYDGDYSTSSASSGAFIAVFYINYTKPSSVLNTSLWQVKDGIGTVNLTIPSACFNLYQNKLLFRVRSDGSENFGFWECQEEGDVYIELRSSALGANIFEETMIWNLSGAVNPQTSTLNVGDTVSFNWTINATGDTDTQYYIDVNFSSSYDNDFISDNNTIDSLICIGTSCSPAPPADECSCPGSGDWVIDDGSRCTLTNTCDLGDNRLIINYGVLEVTDAGRLLAYGGCAISSSPQSGLVTQMGGQTICR